MLVLQLVIYGIDGVLVPEEALFPFDADFLTNYLTGTLRPGSAEVPLSLVVQAVEAGQTASVAEAALTASTNGYLQQVLAIYDQAVGNQEAILALAAVGNEALRQSSCAAVTPLLRQIPSAEDLQETKATQRLVAQRYPALVKCRGQL